MATATVTADPSPPSRPCEIFCSYSHRDEEYREQLVKHLALLRRRGVIKLWHDRQLVPGEQWSDEIMNQLRRADLILLLVSPDFIASDFIFDVELDEALKRHDRGEARAIPIILRFTDLELAPFAKIQALPKDAKPIKSWDDRDEAWVDVVKGIRRAIASLPQAGLQPKALPPTDVEAGMGADALTARAMTQIRDEFSIAVERSMASRQLPKPNDAQLDRLLNCLVEIKAEHKLLWVDDNPGNNAVEIGALRQLQIEIVTVTDTEQALTVLEQGGFDLIISDWERLPTLEAGTSEGQRLLRLARARYPAIPVVFYYGPYNHEQKQRELFAEGASGATFRTDELFTLISGILATRG